MTVQLAKHYNDNKIPKSTAGYFVTEKLDGNRCIAEHDGEKWNFYSRNGKPLHVSFDMRSFSPSRIYDGEIISAEYMTNRKAADFNALNGIIQRQRGEKNDIVYAVFDIIDEAKPYAERRAELDEIAPTQSGNAFVLPLLARYETAEELRANLPELLDEITNAGGEGLMINNGGATYQPKRTNALLKVKNTLTIDMRVTGITDGTGKCAGMIGALKCVCICDDGREIVSEIGSGFDDKERRAWYENPAEIIGKIVEIAYFETQQNEETKGTNRYSLRFPRFIRIRSDKTQTSEY